MRLLSWNIGRVYPLGDRFPFAPLIPGIARTLNQARPDVILLHEVFGHPVRRALLARLEREYDWGMTWMPRSDRETLIFFPRGAQLETRELIAPGGRSMLVSHGRLEGCNIRIAAAHACAYAPEDRKTFFDTLLDHLDAGPPPALDILAGDFNLVYRHAQGLDAQILEQILGTWIDTDPRGTHTFLGIARLDYVLYRHTEQIEVSTRFECLNGELQALQDHDPVVVDFQIAA